MSKKIFISLPYTHDDKEVMYWRANHARDMMVQITRDGNSPVCPVVIGLDILRHDPQITMSYDEWLDFSLTYMQGCDEMWLLCIDGHEKSVGVSEEIKLAISMGINIVKVM